MKISRETLAVLKNFAAINSNLLLKKGSSISTMNVQKNVLADATVAETFPIEFGIYDTNEFLGIIGLFDNPDIEFNERYAIFREGTSSVKFYAADQSVLVVPQKKIKPLTSDITFELTDAQLAKIQKTAAVLRAVDVSVIGDGYKLSIVIGDLKNETSNNYYLDLDSTGAKFTANFKVENLKLMGGLDYTVSISPQKISSFVSTDDKMIYFVALESTSVFND